MTSIGMQFTPADTSKYYFDDGVTGLKDGWFWSLLDADATGPVHDDGVHCLFCTHCLRLLTFLNLSVEVRKTKVWRVFAIGREPAIR